MSFAGRFHPPLRYTVPATLLTIAVILLWVSYLAETAAARRRVEEGTSRRLRVLGAVLSDDIEHALRHNQMSRLSSTLAHARSDPDVSVAVLVDDGNRVLASSDPLLRDRKLEDTVFAQLAEEIAAARQQPAPVITPFTADDRVLIVPVNLADSTAPAGPGGRGVLVLSLNTRHPIAAATAAARRRTAVVTLVLLLSTLVAWLLFNRMLLSRMNHLFAAAQRVGSGDFTTDFTLPGRDELADLGSALARMTSQLRTHAEEIRGNRSALEESHERFAALAAILQASPDFVGTADAATLRVTWINKAGRRMVGLGEDEDVSHLTIHDFQPTWVLESLLDEILSVVKAGGVWTGEAATRHRDGHEIPVLKTVVAHRRPDGQVDYISTVARDLRDRKQLEAQLLQAQKMESIGRLAGGVAHDFNNMLTAIIGYTELAKAQLPHDHPVQSDLENVNEAARRSAALTRQLLAFARKQVISPRPVHLNELIAGIDAMLNRLLGEDVRLATRLKPQLAPVLIDPGQFEQVLMNLAVNARDAMPNGGTLSIETDDVSLDEAWCQQHPGATPGEYGAVRVSDTGVGMSLEAMDHLFEPFFTTKPSGEGTGLGLAMCYGIVKQSGGTIWVSSEPGRGTTFDIYLPRSTGALARNERRGAGDAVTRSGGRETILLIEDETVVRELAYRALSVRGYQILTAIDGPDALEIARNHKGVIDLVLSDVVMPHMTAAELSAKLRQYRPGVRLLFMSGYSETAVYSHGVIQAGAALIEKPFTPESLARQVREALDVTA